MRGRLKEESVSLETGTTPGRALLRVLLKERATLLVAIAVSVVGAGVSLAQPLVINQLISSIGHQPVRGWVLLVVVLVLAAAFLQGLRQYILTRTGESAILRLRRQLVHHLLRLPISVHDSHRTGDLVTRLSSDTTMVRTAFTGGLLDAFGGLILVSGAIIAMALIDPMMLLVVLVVSVSALCLIVFASRKIQHLTTTAQEAVGRLGASMERALSAIRTVRATSAERQMDSEIASEAETAYRQGVRIARIDGILGPSSGLAMQAAFLAVLGVGGARVVAGKIDVAELVSFVLFLFLVTMPMSQIVTAIITVRGALGAMERIQEILRIPSESANDRLKALEVAHLPYGGKDLVVEGVAFRYHTGEVALVNVSLQARPGEFVAVVGPSGSGKSTLLSLIERFYNADSGRILLDGESIYEMDRRALRQQIAYVEQSAPVLAGSVRENLLLGGAGASDKECWDALRSVNLEQRFLDSRGLESPLGDRGINLSGGERQRLSLARLLLSEAPILLLDEPTSSVDSHNEDLIQTAISASARDRTVVMVAHRLSTVQAADRIFVLDSGRVAAHGNHHELMRDSPVYRSLAVHQHLDRGSAAGRQSSTATRVGGRTTED